MRKDWKDHLAHWLDNGNSKVSETVRSSNMSFIQNFPIESLAELTLENYKENFCDYLDYELNNIGDSSLLALEAHSIIIAYFSYKFGLGTNKKSLDFNNNIVKKDSFNYIKNGLLEFLSHAVLGNFSRLDIIGNVNLKNLFFLRSKVLYLYFPDRFLPIFSPIHQKHFVKIFEKEFSGSFHYENFLFLQYLNGLPDFSGFDSWQIIEFLYSEFPPVFVISVLSTSDSQYIYDVDILEVINYYNTESISTINKVLQNNQELPAIENKSTNW